MKQIINLSIFFVFISCFSAFAQENEKEYFVSKSWMGTNEDWIEFTLPNKIYVTTDDECYMKIINNDFLNTLYNGKIKLKPTEKDIFAEFINPKKVSETTDNNGVKSVTFNGMMLVQQNESAFSVLSKVVLLEKGNDIIGAKIKLNDNAKEFIFTLKIKELGMN